MLIKKEADLTYADVTPKATYFNRRQILKAMGIAAVGGSALSRILTPSTSVYAGAKLDVAVKSPFSTTKSRIPTKM